MRFMKIFVTLEPETVRRIDALIEQRAFRHRSDVVQSALDEKFDRLLVSRLVRECAKLDPGEDKGYGGGACSGHGVSRAMLIN